MEGYCLEASAILDFSVVVPVYNGAASLCELCEGILNCLGEHTLEIILVDDASKDESWQVIERLKTSYPFILALQHSHNKGQTASLFTGFKASSGQYIITMDDDLQFSPADIA